MPHLRRLAAAATFALVAIALTAPASAENFTWPTTYVVKFHADWCGSCKAMGPVMRDLGNKLGNDPVMFIELDLTNNKTSRQARFLAGALGFGKVFAAHAPKTGFILVIDVRTMKVRAKLTKKNSFKEMVAAIRAETRAGSRPSPRQRR